MYQTNPSRGHANPPPPPGKPSPYEAQEKCTSDWSGYLYSVAASLLMSLLAHYEYWYFCSVNGTGLFGAMHMETEVLRSLGTILNVCSQGQGGKVAALLLLGT